MTWTPPSSPDSPLYREILTDIELDPEPARAAAKFAALCEEDFYAFVKYACNFGEFQIRDPGHWAFGGFWVDQPFIFDRCRICQDDVEHGHTDIWYNWPRFYFKTELVTKLLSVWETLRDPQLTTAMIFWKTEQVGEQFFLGLETEILTNDRWMGHWPHIFCRTKSEYERFTVDAVTLKRQPGPREPTYSLHSISSYPTSGHFRRIRFDDVVTQDTVLSPRTIKATYDAIKGCVAIGSEDTLTTFAATVWDQYDPHMQLDKEGYFSRRDKVSAIDSTGEPVLRSRKFIERWRQKMGPYVFSAQMMNEVVARGDQRFLFDWLKRYIGHPMTERPGKNVHAFLDTSSGKIGSDFSSLRVIGLGQDRKLYHLDLIRERFDLVALLEAIFTVVKRWAPVDSFWIEEGGEDRLFQSIKQAMEVNHYRFNLRRLPIEACKRSKESRISHSQVAHQRGEHYYPEDGFGHGSKGDDRDTLTQLWDDEMRFWTPLKGSTLTDDMLDAGAWPDQPEVRGLMQFPVLAQASAKEQLDQDLREYVEQQRARFRLSTAAGISPWAH